MEVFFSSLAVSIQLKLEWEYQKGLMDWHKDMLREHKKGMRNALPELLSEYQLKKKVKLLGKVEIEEDAYETIAPRYESTLELDNSKQKNIALKKIAVITKNMEHVKETIEKSRPQPALVTREKSDFYCLYSFNIRSVAIDRALINIMDSGTETLLLSSGWVIVKICG